MTDRVLLLNTERHDQKKNFSRLLALSRESIFTNFPWLLSWNQMKSLNDIPTYFFNLLTITRKAKEIWHTENEEVDYYWWKCILTIEMRKKQYHFVKTSRIPNNINEFQTFWGLEIILQLFMTFPVFPWLQETCLSEVRLLYCSDNEQIIGLQ